MAVIGVLLLGVAVGFLSCLLVRLNGQRSIAYVYASVGVVFGAIFVSVTAGQNQMSWYLDALAIGVLLYWLTALRGPGEIRRLLTKIKIRLW